MLAEARAAMLEAASLYDRGVAVLQRAMRSLKRHPDYARTQRARLARRDHEAPTLVAWAAGEISDAGTGPGELAAWLRKNAAPGALEAALAEFMRTEREFERNARRRRLARRRREVELGRIVDRVSRALQATTEATRALTAIAPLQGQT